MRNKYQSYFTFSLILALLTSAVLAFHFLFFLLCGWGKADGAEPALFFEFIANYGFYFVPIYFLIFFTITIVMKNKANKLKKILAINKQKLVIPLPA